MEKKRNQQEWKLGKLEICKKRVLGRKKSKDNWKLRNWEKKGIGKIIGNNSNSIYSKNVLNI